MSANVNNASTCKGVPGTTVSVTVGSSAEAGRPSGYTRSDVTAPIDTQRRARVQDPFESMDPNILQQWAVYQGLEDPPTPEARVGQPRAETRVRLRPSKKKANREAWGIIGTTFPDHETQRRLLVAYAEAGQNDNDVVTRKTIRRRFASTFHPDQIQLVNDKWEFIDTVGADEVEETAMIVEETAGSDAVVTEELLEAEKTAALGLDAVETEAYETSAHDEDISLFLKVATDSYPREAVGAEETAGHGLGATETDAEETSVLNEDNNMLHPQEAVGADETDGPGLDAMETGADETSVHDEENIMLLTNLEAAMDHYSSQITKKLKFFSMTDTERKGTYGHHQKSSVVTLINFLVDHTSLDENSVFVDFGAGMNGPAFFASHISGCTSFGVECDPGRAYSAMDIIKTWVRGHSHLDERILCRVVNYFFADAMTLGKFGSAFTHAYCWDSAMSIWDALTLFNKFLESEAEYGVFYVDKAGSIEYFDDQRAYASRFGWSLERLTQLPMYAAAGGGQRTACVFKKTSIVPVRHPRQTRLGTILQGYLKLTLKERMDHLQCDYGRFMPDPSDLIPTRSITKKIRDLRTTLEFRGQPEACKNKNSLDPCPRLECWYCMSKFAGVQENMLVVQKSKFANAGQGLFLHGGNLAENTILGEYVGTTTDTADPHTMQVVISASSGVNKFQYVNHSCGPNCVIAKGTTAPPDNHVTQYIIALRDLYDNEEITIDYGADRRSKFKCTCNICFANSKIIPVQDAPIAHGFHPAAMFKARSNISTIVDGQLYLQYKRVGLIDVFLRDRCLGSSIDICAELVGARPDMILPLMKTIKYPLDFDSPPEVRSKGSALWGIFFLVLRQKGGISPEDNMVSLSKGVRRVTIPCPSSLLLFWRFGENEGRLQFEFGEALCCYSFLVCTHPECDCQQQPSKSKRNQIEQA